MTGRSPSAAPLQVLSQAQLIAGASVGAALLLAVVVGLIGPSDALPGIAVPATLLGLVSPAIAYRLPQVVRERLSPDVEPGQRCAAYLRGVVLALAVAEGAAMLGIVAYLLSGKLSSLVGVLTLVLVAGALWPSEDRLTAFIERPGREGS
jgi:hypothetical protein